MSTIEATRTLPHNADFLFIYEAIQCNPNGDPDQENKPRMDYETKTNLVTDVRLKRYVRDYLKQNGLEVFVDMEGDSKVSADSKLKAVIDRLMSDEAFVNEVFADQPEYKKLFLDLMKKKKDGESIFKMLQGAKKGSKELDLNRYILEYLVKARFLDIRLFGSAFAVAGFTKAYTGPVQINWGYSLHPVELMESNSLVTIMADDNSTFGKDYRIHYSLLAFHGTINKHQARRTGMSEEDAESFRDALWKSIPCLPTRSKQNQYPKFYLEIIYNDDCGNGSFGDLRQHLSVSPKEGKTEKQIRNINDLTIDFSALKALLEEHTGEGKAIKEVIVKSAPAFEHPFGNA
ncbi:type I-B CRISPR-associated protein Cas7/Csh2 [Roseivirga sp. BDSF3-8]|uniref:type I-B CRISPR-associated protein Cas7/Csh2 n=1 Tax=Roseivirga sp. BDSF3-8 TaxID=3241598 RepID=UPI003531C3A9